MKKIIYAKCGFLIFVGILLSCNRKFCDNDNFYSTYQTRFQKKEYAKDFTETDLEVKQKIFSTLCISNSVKKMLIVEFRNGIQSDYSRGLIFTYDDSKTYYYKIKDGKVIAGRGNSGYIDLNRILSQVKSDFWSEKIKLDKAYDDVFDASIVNVVLYDSLMPKKFNSFNFPAFMWDRLYPR